jgi:hypothetical protein
VDSAERSGLLQERETFFYLGTARAAWIRLKRTEKGLNWMVFVSVPMEEGREVGR